MGTTDRSMWSTRCVLRAARVHRLRGFSSDSKNLHGGLFQSRGAHLSAIAVAGTALFAGLNTDRLSQIGEALGGGTGAPKQKHATQRAAIGSRVGQTMMPLDDEEHASLAMTKSLSNLKSERITQATFNRYLTQLGVPNDERRNKLWERLVADSNGMVATKDFMLATTILAKAAGNRDLRSIADDFFAIIDTDNNQSVDLPEIESFFCLLVRLGRVNDTDEAGARRAAGEFMMLYDTDQDGKLSKAEFSKALPSVSFTIG